jgi:hypothetical protein
LRTTETRLDGSSFDTEIEFVFEDQGRRTLMKMIHRGFPTPELRDEHRVGLPNAFAQLQDVVNEAQPGSTARTPDPEDHPR